MAVLVFSIKVATGVRTEFIPVEARWVNLRRDDCDNGEREGRL